jgi:hypothetical protein
MTPEQRKYLEKVEKGTKFKGDNEFLKRAKEWWDFHFGSSTFDEMVTKELKDTQSKDKSDLEGKPDKSSLEGNLDKSSLTKPKKPSK